MGTLPHHGHLASWLIGTQLVEEDRIRQDKISDREKELQLETFSGMWRQGGALLLDRAATCKL